MSYHNVQRTRLSTALNSEAVSLEIRQQPHQALVTNEHKEKTRKAIDPPPVVQLKVNENVIHDSRRNWLVSPFIFMNVMLVYQQPETNGLHRPIPGNNLLGQTVSSLHRLKDVHNNDGGFFVFGDISCRKQGTYRLQFNLFDFENSEVIFVGSKVSDPFHVVMSKDFHGQRESTQLSRKFSEQGVRLRLRKEQRSVAGRKRSFDDSPTQPSAPPLAPNLLPNSQQDRGYGYHDPKRQRSDEYNPQMYYSQQVSSNALYPYGTQASASAYGMAGQTVQTSPLDTRYSSLPGQSYSLPDANTAWQRSAPQQASVSGYGNTAYLPTIATTTSLIRNHPAPSQPPQQAQHAPLNTADDAFSALGGLHTPPSLPDSTRGSTSGQQQNFLAVAPDTSSSASAYGAGHAGYGIHQQQGTGDPSHQFEYRGGISNQFIPDYQSNMPPLSSAPSYHQVPTNTSVHQYGHDDYPATVATDENNYEENARESFAPGASNLSQSNVPLDSGVLNRGFLPPTVDRKGNSVLEQSTPHYKDPPYPTPHHTSPMGL